MRALVIDDSKPVRSILSRMFGELGFDVRQTCNGEEALALLESGPLPDVVTVNWNMPVMDGVSFLKAVRQHARFRDLRIVMISMEADPGKITAAKQSGADDYLVKPLDQETLRATLEKLGVFAGRQEQAVPTEAVPTEAAQLPVRTSNVCRVLVVDDSVVIRRTLTKVLDADPELEVVASAADGRIALDVLAQVMPDVVLLDVEMPNMNGLETLRHLRKSYPALPVIMFSALTERGAAVTMDALILGADDYVPKPAAVSDFRVAQQCICDELIPRIKQFTDRRLRHQSAGSVTTVRKPSPTPGRRHMEVVVVGISTGGPQALVKMLPQFTGTFSVPIVIVQHMPPIFTQYLAERLAKCTMLDVVEGQNGQLLQKGQVVVAPGGSHTVLQRRGSGLAIALNQDPPENSCRPSADVLLRSAAAVCGAGTLAVIMTGMGKDGLHGCRAVVGAGGRVLAQDEMSSVVWGMPGQVVRAGLADEIVPLDQLCAAIEKILATKA